MLHVSHIYKSYQEKTVLRDISFSLEKGEIFGLLGPNGAGKTTLIRILNQIILPDKGEIWFDNEKLNSSHIRRIGYLPEERGLYRKMKVGEQALYLARLKGLSRQEAQKAIRYWFEKFEITGWWNKKVEELSKGMAQKVQFICTVLHNPQLLILDEPFSGFDPINAELILNEIITIKEKGTAIIFSTHNMHSVEHLCDKVLLINRSEKILEGKVNEIKDQYKDDTYKVRFHGSVIAFTQALQHWFEIIHIEEKNAITTAIVKSTDKTHKGKELLLTILPHVEILSFEELLPSMHEIFIQKVKESNPQK